MQQVQMVPGPGPEPKMKVYYEGTDTLLNGYLLCSNTDYTASALTIGPLSVAAITAASASRERWTRAEKPAAANVHRFLGAVVGLGGAGRAGPGMFDVARPCGAMADLYTDASCTIDTTALYLKPGSYAAGSTGVRRIGLAAQTINRSTTNGLVLAYMDAPGQTAANIVLAAKARTTVQLPTAAIWNALPMADLRANPGNGSILVADFTDQNGFPVNRFNDTTSIQVSSALAYGTWIMTTTDDNSACEIQWPVPILTTGGNPWGFEARFKIENVTTEKASFSIGLHEYVTLVGDLQADAGALPTAANYLVFNSDAAATTALDTIYLLTGQASNEHAAAIHTLVADTYLTVGLFYNGTTIQQYINGVAAGTSITAVDIAAADFPAAKILLPSVGLKGAHGDAFSMTLDWVVAAQAGY